MIHAQNNSGLALFNLGFRPFFLGAVVYSVIVVLVWMAIYAFNIPLPMDGLSAFQWHSHEMIFGYSMAVIAGFLLTAIKNWTGIQTVHGTVLAIIFFLWLLARLLFLFGSTWISIAALFDLSFMFAVLFAAAWPVVKSKNWRQLGILSILLFLAIANSSFYLGYAGLLEQGMHWGIYGGLYLVVALILTLGGRVIPFFTKNGIDYPVQLYSPKWVTLLGLLIFLVFFISELFLHNNALTGYTAIVLFIIYSIRLIGWYTPGIWKRPLLWSLHIATLFIVIGFLLFALSVFAGTSKYLAVHAMAYGGIGMITVSMIARVSLGHTGRNINEPPATVKYTLTLLLLGAVFRVLLPIIYFDYYYVWVVISQLLWVMAFSLLAMSYLTIWIKPRIDGQFG